MRVLAAFFGLWFLGVSLGLLISVLSELAQEFRQIINMAMMPLYFISGVMFPLASIPEPYREWLLLNPIAHGLEEARSGFAPYYRSEEHTSELQSLMRISYAVFCLNKKKNTKYHSMQSINQ